MVHFELLRPPGRNAETAGHYVLLLLFQPFFLFVYPPNLRGRSVDCHQTLQHVRTSMVTLIHKFGRKFWGPIPKHLPAQKHQNSNDFMT